MSVSHPEYGAPPIERPNMEKIWDKARADARAEGAQERATLRRELHHQTLTWLETTFPKTKLTVAQKDSLAEVFGLGPVPAGLSQDSDPAGQSRLP
jgi:hypothetical protein